MKLVSFAIPTLNRAQYLRFTLESFVPQMKRFSDVAEIVVCNNASDDNTADVVKEFEKQYGFIRLVDCKNRVDLGDSFKRTAAAAEGKYLILWGDDDIPSPGLMSHILDLIDENPDVEFFHFNGITGYDAGLPIKNIKVEDNCYASVGRKYTTTTNFINDHFTTATFITSDLISKELWDRGAKIDTTPYYGYEFMAIIYFGNGNNPIYYSNYPMYIGRKVRKRAWSSKFAQYALLGLPNLSLALEKAGLYENGLNTWYKKFNRLSFFIYTLFGAATNKKLYRPMCKDFARYQKSIFRKGLVYCIINVAPAWIYNLSRNILYNIKTK